MSYFNDKQVEVLLQPIRPSRVLSLKQSKGPALSYVAQHDVRAHLNRVFGFGRWSMDVKETHFMFEEQNEAKRWKACYRATVRLTIHAPDGTEIAHYEDSHASGNMPQPDRADAHALALTIAVSTAMKRAATCLGDQFGLSLYNKGQTLPFVKTTLVGVAEATFDDDVKILSLGDVEGGGMPEEEAPAEERSTVERTEPETGVLDAHMVEPEPATPAAAVEAEFEAAVAAALGELRVFSALAAPGERIIQVAAWKQANSAFLTQTTEVGGQSITLGVLADQVAAGKFTKEN